MTLRRRIGATGKEPAPKRGRGEIVICVLAALEGHSGGFLDGDRVEDSLRLSKALERLYGGFRARNARGSPWETSGGYSRKRRSVAWAKKPLRDR